MKTDMRIQSVTEAFAMQPACFTVGGNIHGKKISHINQQMIKINGDPFDAVIGYDKDGNRLFEFMRNSVNLTYQEYKEPVTKTDLA